MNIKRNQLTLKHDKTTTKMHNLESHDLNRLNENKRCQRMNCIENGLNE